jgi:phage gpG-like protein
MLCLNPYTINVLITNSGTKHPKIKKLQTLIGKRRDLSRSLLSTYNEDLDNAFQIMERTLISLLTGDSKYYTVFNLIVQHTAQFNDHFSIQKKSNLALTCAKSRINT